LLSLCANKVIASISTNSRLETNFIATPLEQSR
jgi:hypothetical protein